MTKLKLGGSYTTSENIFEVFKKVLLDASVPNAFEGRADVSVCKVLRIWEIPVGKIRNTWMDLKLMGHGSKEDTKVIMFKGRLVSSDDDFTLTSALPDPEIAFERGLTDSSLVTSTAAAPDASTKAMLARNQQQVYIDMHPTFIGVLATDKTTPKAGDNLEVSFMKVYEEAAGEWFGIIVNFEPQQGDGWGFSPVTDTELSKKAFDIKVRQNSEHLLPVQPPANVPRRFLFIGDEMFGASTFDLNRSTRFAKKIQADIKSLYSTLKSCPSPQTNPDGVERIMGILEKQFDIPMTILLKVADVLDGAGGYIPVPEFWNISCAFVDGSFYAESGADFYTNNHKGKLRVGLPVSKVKFGAGGPPTPEGNNFATKFTEEVNSGNEVLKLALSDEVKSENWDEAVESETGWNGGFDFAIIGGLSGYSADPGWARPIAAFGDPGSEYDGYLSYAFSKQDVPSSALADVNLSSADIVKKIDYERTQEYARLIARAHPDEFRAVKVKHYKSFVDELMGTVKAAIWLGPPLLVGYGRADIKQDKKKEYKKKISIRTDREIGGTYGEYERHRLHVTDLGSKAGAAGATYDYSPIFDSEFDLRWQTSKAILEACEGKEIYPCLAYCSEYYDLDDIIDVEKDREKYDGIAKDFNIEGTRQGGPIYLAKSYTLAGVSYLNGASPGDYAASSINNEINNEKAQRAYGNWVIRALCKHIATLPAASMKTVKDAHWAGVDEELKEMAAFNKDRDFLDRWELDMYDRWQGELQASKEFKFFNWKINIDKLSEMAPGLHHELKMMSTKSKEIADKYMLNAEELSDWWNV